MIRNLAEYALEDSTTVAGLNEELCVTVGTHCRFTRSAEQESGREQCASRHTLNRAWYNTHHALDCNNPLGQWQFSV